MVLQAGHLEPQEARRIRLWSGYGFQERPKAIRFVFTSQCKRYCPKDAFPAPHCYLLGWYPCQGLILLIIFYHVSLYLLKYLFPLLL